jgi:hypothetical protein
VLQCQILDAGTASRIGYVGDTGRSLPPWPSSEGHGLWLVRQAADELSIVLWNRPGGRAAGDSMRWLPSRIRRRSQAGEFQASRRTGQRAQIAFAWAIWPVPRPTEMKPDM